MQHGSFGLTPKRAVIVRVMARYVSYGYALTYWEFGGLCALMQAGGLTLNLSLIQSVRGLHAHRLVQTLEHLEGVCFRGFLAHQLERPLSVEHLALKQAQLLLGAHPQHRAFVLDVSRLIEGFESPYGVWLLSQCWWLRTHEQLSWGQIVKHLGEPSARVDAARARLESSALWDVNTTTDST